MAHWAVIIPDGQWATERLFHHDTLTLATAAEGIAADDEVLLIADDQVVALARAGKTNSAAPAGKTDSAAQAGQTDSAAPAGQTDSAAPAGMTDGAAQAGQTDGAGLVLTYLRRSFDAPVPPEGLTLTGAVTPVEAETFRRLAARLGAARGTDQSWLVSVALPIEAANPAEAVRQFWSHVLELGPVELPTYVWPLGDELAMQVYVLGDEANQDPEEEDDED